MEKLVNYHKRVARADVVANDLTERAIEYFGVDSLDEVYELMRQDEIYRLTDGVGGKKVFEKESTRLGVQAALDTIADRRLYMRLQRKYRDCV